MKVLVTGFDPFGGESINPAYEAVKMLPDEIAGAQIIKREIPTSFTRGTAEVVRQNRTLPAGSGAECGPGRRRCWFACRTGSHQPGGCPYPG